MASIGHVAVGLAVARFSNAERPWPTRAALVVLALLPDADVIGFALGIPYAAPWGHRGATHSLLFAALVAPLLALAARALGLGRVRAVLLAFVALASHGLLDAMTTGGLGAALLWPFDDARIFFGWRPIPVAPIGLSILRPRGLLLMLQEALFFLPLWLVAGWPARPKQPR